MPSRISRRAFETSALSSRVRTSSGSTSLLGLIEHGVRLMREGYKITLVQTEFFPTCLSGSPPGGAGRPDLRTSAHMTCSSCSCHAVYQIVWRRHGSLERGSYGGTGVMLAL